MAFRYPNGKMYTSTSQKRPVKNNVTYSNRGMTLEEDINVTNSYYLAAEVAVIHKKPTPLQIVKVDYPKRSAAVVKEAYFKQPSTTDYNGVYRGKHIDFEAKETKNKTSFPLKNFHDHQVQHMKTILNQGGICFVLLRFSSHDEVYLLDASYLISYYQEKEEKRKSIPKQDIEQYGHFIKTGYHPRIDYLKTVDEVYFSHND
ncbi:Holliday junction resolvase RecU [Desertibacillus haloalkaliphilus]|uniref:Holliday junction resolvase RecU n=1 Tax=Desertibacillus haloalkaliphilus TaxID=1328930 RepID=UPI001C271634|nr:Holliday junction resolvase RecU [Desertibacillus haloalkaliphilus]MBU8907293.1 Holliday junction resolvase RecU [Desertibacillus haloalkaliphilus]